MAEYIEREAILESLRESHKALKEIYKGLKFPVEKQIASAQLTTFIECILRVKNAPAADVVEVKHGYWQDKFNRNRMATQSFCSVCGKHSGIGGIESNRHKPYCPNCGAKMDGERKCDNENPN
jgi:hypothetical protein